LPVIFLVLADYHMLTKLRKRGIFRHMLRHFWITLPFIAVLALLAIYATIPSNDPIEFGMPLEGEHIPAPESVALLILLPFKYFNGPLVPLLSIYIPAVLLFAVAFMPYYLKSKKFVKSSPVDEYDEEEDEGAAPGVDEEKGEGALMAGTETPGLEFESVIQEEKDAPVKKPRSGLVTGVLWGLLVFFIFSVFSGLMYYGTYESPTLGCNSCHNLSRGFRMGVPPPTFQDRKTLPNLDDDRWMMGHWFYPTEIY
jgi:hypothetical protein